MEKVICMTENQEDTRKTGVGQADKLHASVKVQADGTYEEVRESLILRPLNVSNMGQELEEVPHLVLGDIALMLYIVMEQQGTDYFTMKVNRERLNQWGICAERVFQNALCQTGRLYPAKLYSIEDLLNWALEKGRKEGISRKSIGYMLTNSLQINGAIAVFYPGVAKTIAEAMGDDLLIAFTSIHEAQLHAASRLEPEAVEDSLQKTNRQCNRAGEILTDSVYRYCRKDRIFQRLENGKFREETFWIEGQEQKKIFYL